MAGINQRTPEQNLERWLGQARVSAKPVYSAGEVQRILCLSAQNFRNLCDLYEDTGGLSGLRPTRETGSTHRKVSHDDLVDYIGRREQQIRQRQEVA